MARILIRQAHGGATRIISDPALPYFLNQGWVVLDTLDDDTDASPLYLSAAESDLRYARISDLGDPESAEVAVISEAVADSEALRAASVAAVEDAGTVAPTGAWDFTQAPTVGGVPVGGGGPPGTDLGWYDVTDFGAVGDGVTDDTAAINAAMNAARLQGVRRGGTVYLPPGRYLVSAPIKLYTAVSIVGAGWSLDTTYYNTSAIIAAPGFVGSAVILQDPDGGVVYDTGPEGRPDESWHWGTIEKIAVVGNGITGPHGIDPGWNGEASSIRNVQINNCNSGIYLSDVQASAALYAVSTFDCNIGVNCDNIQSTVRIFGLSGDNNTNLLRVKGGLSANVTVVGMKAENFQAGKGDPVILIEDLLGGAFTLLGGWADADTARSAVIRINQPAGGGQRARLFVAGFHHATAYANLLNDTFDGRVIPRGVNNDLSYPLLTYNVNAAHLGAGDTQIGYAKNLNGTAWEGTAMALVSSGASNEVTHRAGGGAPGGLLTSQDGAWAAMQWRKNGGNNLGFYGAEPVTRPSGVPVTAAGIHAALVSLGLITA